MTLKSQLDEKAEELASMAPAEIQKVMVDSIDAVATSGISETSIGVGDQAPAFTLPSADGSDIHLEDLLSAGPVAVTFYRGEWCPYCNLQLAALQAALPEIEAAGGSLVAISPQTPDSSLSMKEKAELKFPVLSDAGADVIRQYGLAYAVDAGLKGVFDAFGTNLTEINGTENWELPATATYVIGTDGIVTFAAVSADYRLRAEPADVVAAVQAASN